MPRRRIPVGPGRPADAGPHRGGPGGALTGGGELERLLERVAREGAAALRESGDAAPPEDLLRDRGALARRGRELPSSARRPLSVALGASRGLHLRARPRTFRRQRPDGSSTGVVYDAVSSIALLAETAAEAVGALLRIAVPASVAGVPRIVLAAPASVLEDPLVARAAAASGVTEALAASGAPAAALLSVGATGILAVEILFPGASAEAAAVWRLVSRRRALPRPDLAVVADGRVPLGDLALDLLGSPPRDIVLLDVGGAAEPLLRAALDRAGAGARVPPPPLAVRAAAHLAEARAALGELRPERAVLALEGAVRHARRFAGPSLVLAGPGALPGLAAWGGADAGIPDPSPFLRARVVVTLAAGRVPLAARDAAELAGEAGALAAAAALRQVARGRSRS